MPGLRQRRSALLPAAWRPSGGQCLCPRRQPRHAGPALSAEHHRLPGLRPDPGRRSAAAGFLCGLCLCALGLGDDAGAFPRPGQTLPVRTDHRGRSGGHGHRLQRRAPAGGLHRRGHGRPRHRPLDQYHRSGPRQGGGGGQRIFHRRIGAADPRPAWPGPGDRDDQHPQPYRQPAWFHGGGGASAGPGRHLRDRGPAGADLHHAE